MTLRRFVQRCIFYPLRFVVNCVSFVSHRIYMLLNGPLLRRFGLKLDGQPRYIATSVYFDDLDLIELGDGVVISSHVRFLTHDYSATTALKAIGKPPMSDIALQRGIKVGRNVFIGMSSIVMPNTWIGDNVIVGAGSVVRGRIPSNSVVLGNPATVVMSIEEAASRTFAELSAGRYRQDQ